MKNKFWHLAIVMVLFSCSKNNDTLPETPDESILYTLPVVVHVIHSGESEGEGSNLSTARIKEQIESLNDDFRRVPGTLGENNFPYSDDAFIRFKLAERTPDGDPTNGIGRVNYFDVNPDKGDDDHMHDWLPQLGYWDPEKYINIWVYGGFNPNENLGLATLPTTDLPGLEKELQVNGDGIMINAHHFGKSGATDDDNLGKTLTHEMGHFLGLYHLWGRVDGKPCLEQDDFVEDTPPVAGPLFNCDDSQLACDGQPAPVSNYMNLTSDKCMNTFTKGQIARMRHVLKNAVRRKSLTSSDVITR